MEVSNVQSQSNWESIVSSDPVMAAEIGDSYCPGSRNCLALSISAAGSALTASADFSS